MQRSSINRLHKKIIELDVPACVIAEKSGIKSTRISEYRHGKRQIPMKDLIVLCDVLNCDPSELMGDVEVDEVVYVIFEEPALNEAHSG